MELNKIYNEECIGDKELGTGMWRIPDKSVDLILCDLPYGSTKNQWDSVIPFESLWGHYKRIIKDNGAIVLTSQQPFTTALINSNIKMFRYEWIWEKSRVTGFLNAKRRPLTTHENIVIFSKKQTIYNPQKWKIDDRFVDRRKKLDIENYRQSNYGSHTKTKHKEDDGTRYPQSVLPINSENTEKTGHPTQKPVSLFEYLIRTYTNENAIILDNCIGSGTTAIATMNVGEGRNYIGFEMDNTYFNVSNERIEKHKESLLVNT